MEPFGGTKNERKIAKSTAKATRARNKKLQLREFKHM